MSQGDIPGSRFAFVLFFANKHDLRLSQRENTRNHGAIRKQHVYEHLLILGERNEDLLGQAA